MLWCQFGESRNRPLPMVPEIDQSGCRWRMIEQSICWNSAMITVIAVCTWFGPPTLDWKQSLGLNGRVAPQYTRGLTPRIGVTGPGREWVVGSTTINKRARWCYQDGGTRKLNSSVTKLRLVSGHNDLILIRTSGSRWEFVGEKLIVTPPINSRILRVLGTKQCREGCWMLGLLTQFAISGTITV